MDALRLVRDPGAVATGSPPVCGSSHHARLIAGLRHAEKVTLALSQAYMVIVLHNGTLAAWDRRAHRRPGTAASLLRTALTGLDDYFNPNVVGQAHGLRCLVPGTGRGRSETSLPPG